MEDIIKTITYGEHYNEKKLTIDKDELYLLHASIEKLDTKRWAYYLNLLPINLKDEVLKYKKWPDRYNSLFGKLLVHTGYYLFERHELSFGNFLRNSYGKPYVKNVDLSFNISHSGNKVVCAFGKDEVGVDVEEIREINYLEFASVFSDNEVEQIIEKGQLKFFELWTKKEALSKGVGKGFSISFSEMIIHEKFAIYDNYKWFIDGKEYKGSYYSVASSYPFKEIKHICVAF
jgi:4'-phosphopantetheinyl transferase